MPSVKKYLKEAENLKARKELSKEDKLAFLDAQIEGFQKQAYRFEVDIEIAKRYIAVGAEIGGEEAYTETGENKIVEAVQNLRSIVLSIDKLLIIKEELEKE